MPLSHLPEPIPKLTPHDQAILRKLDDPEYTPSAHELNISETLPPDPHVSNAADYALAILAEKGLISRTQKIDLKFAGLVTSTETSPPLSQYLEAVADFSELIERYPNYASLRNNRAQAVRRVYGDGILVQHYPLDPPPPAEAHLNLSSSGYKTALLQRAHAKVGACSHTESEKPALKGSSTFVKPARSSSSFMPPLDAPCSREILIDASSMMLSDLDTAISLLAPTTPEQALSPQAAKTLSSAYTQRGAVYYLTAKQLSITPGANTHMYSLPTSPSSSPREYKLERIASRPELVISKDRREANWGITEFEEAASRDFVRGGRMGNQVAKGLAVAMNPMARLCGGIVEGAMRRERWCGRPNEAEIERAEGEGDEEEDEEEEEEKREEQRDESTEAETNNEASVETGHDAEGMSELRERRDGVPA